MTEQWLPILDYDDYEVSDLGRIGSYERGEFKILKLSTNYGGYMEVSLRKDGVRTTCRVNRLVATAFIGPPPSDKHEAAHRDDVKANNAASNLEWLTHAENLAHAAERGLMAHGEDHYLAKVTEAQVREIRRLYAEGGITYRELGKMFGLKNPAVGRIITLKTWKHVV